MPLTALIGLQWGDEGKGKVVDAMSTDVDVVVRAQGGANAGHTVRVGDTERVLHLVPSGMLYPQVTGVIGHGVVVDPLTLAEEIRTLEAEGLGLAGRLHLSDRAHRVLPGHKALDRAQEARLGSGAIGTTGRGIGPAYMDKAARTGIRAGILGDRDAFAREVRRCVGAKNDALRALGAEPLVADQVLAEVAEAAAFLAPLVVDTVPLLHGMLASDRNVLLEGAQGIMLDLDLGTYPYVTSSNCVLGGLLSGSGFPPRAVSRVIGVAKAYCTRVGAGPFPTEDVGPAGEALRTGGREFGATTGRPRRCGWFDAVAVRHAVALNGVDEIVLTKIDVLAGQPRVRVGMAYERAGKPVSGFPADGLEDVTVRYEDLPGFDGDLGAARSSADLPPEARRLVDHLSEAAGAPVTRISTGPERTQLVERRAV